MISVTTHGPTKSKYDMKVRMYASQWQGSGASLYTVQSNLREDLEKIPRANIGKASMNYSIKIIDEFEPNERIEIWNEVIPGKERHTVTIKHVPNPTPLI